MIQDDIEIGDQVGIPVSVLAARVGQTVADPVLRNHIPVSRQRVRSELPGGGHILEPV